MLKLVDESKQIVEGPNFERNAEEEHSVRNKLYEAITLASQLDYLVNNWENEEQELDIPEEPNFESSKNLRNSSLPSENCPE
jgi:hypothetical protein